MWKARYVGEYPRFLCSSKGLEWEPDETKEVDNETAVLLRGTFPDLFKFEEVTKPRLRKEPPPSPKSQIPVEEERMAPWKGSPQAETGEEQEEKE